MWPFKELFLSIFKSKQHSKTFQKCCIVIGANTKCKEVTYRETRRTCCRLFIILNKPQKILPAKPLLTFAQSYFYSVLKLADSWKQVLQKPLEHFKSVGKLFLAVMPEPTVKPWALLHGHLLPGIKIPPLMWPTLAELCWWWQVLLKLCRIESISIKRFFPKVFNEHISRLLLSSITDQS